MSGVAGRHFLREKEKKFVLNYFSSTFGIDAESLFGLRLEIEVVETLKYRILLVNGVPRLVMLGGDLFPTLFFNEILSSIPKVTVDMGAVPHICNGADMMAPGIVRIDGVFKEKSLVLMVDEKHGKSIAIGRALYDSETSRNLRQGKVFENIHYVGDEIWKAARSVVRNEKVKT